MVWVLITWWHPPEGWVTPDLVWSYTQGWVGLMGRDWVTKLQACTWGSSFFTGNFRFFFKFFFFFSIITQMGEIFSNFLLKSKYRKWYLLGGKPKPKAWDCAGECWEGADGFFCKSLETAATQLATKDVNWLGLFFSWNSSTGGKLVLWIGGLRFWGVPLSNNPFHKGMQKSKPPTQTTNLPLASISWIPQHNHRHPVIFSSCFLESLPFFHGFIDFSYFSNLSTNRGGILPILSWDFMVLRHTSNAPQIRQGGKTKDQNTEIQWGNRCHGNRSASLLSW